MKKIGIVGGGQLGMMMVDAIHDLKMESIVLDPVEKCSCSYNSDAMVVAKYNDFTALEKVCKATDVLTYEFENVSSGAISLLEVDYNIPQGSNLLYISQNRLREKEFAVNSGFTCCRYKEVNNKKELIDAIELIKMPAILKTCAGGYDGKGQYHINSLSDIDEIEIDSQCILEEKIPFDYEISCIASRSLNGEVVVYPLFKNTHVNGILHFTEFLNNDELKEKTEKIMIDYMNNLGYAGTMCVELFVCKDKIIFNEMAPRPHNSGHMTIEACEASQYKNHILGILGMKLIEPTKIHDCVMVNILGQDISKISDMEKEELNIKFHMYNKESANHNRKMGHITIVDEDKEKIDTFMKKYF